LLTSFNQSLIKFLIIIKYWNVDVNYNKEKKNALIKELNKENIIVIGECVSDSHGLVNSALESVELNFNL
jgi:soluble P-type ATPase